jgi:broad specificity phosphatase PhoE
MAEKNLQKALRHFADIIRGMLDYFSFEVNSSMTSLCLVRHGQTNWNVEGRWQGFADQPLNLTGLAQATQVATELAGYHFDAIYSSGLARAHATAQAIAQNHNMPVLSDHRLREINMGEWEGQLGVDIPALYPKEWAERLYSPLTSRPPGGESLIDLSKRVLPAINELVARHPTGPVLVVSHGLALAVFLCQVDAIPLDQAYDHIPKNARPIWLDWQPAE